MPKNKVWRIPENYFNLNQILCFDLEHLRKTDALLMGSFRLWGVILEMEHRACLSLGESGALQDNFRASDRGHGTESISPEASAQKKESNIGCFARNPQICPDTPGFSPQDIQDVCKG